jgi:hypothetical protein
MPHLTDHDPGGPHPQRLLHQPTQRDLPGTLEIGLAGLHGYDVGQRNAELEDDETAQVPEVRVPVWGTANPGPEVGPESLWSHMTEGTGPMSGWRRRPFAQGRGNG